MSIPNKLIQAAVAAALFAAATGQLPKFIQQVRVAQYQLLKDSQSQLYSGQDGWIHLLVHGRIFETWCFAETPEYFESEYLHSGASVPCDAFK